MRNKDHHTGWNPGLHVGQRYPEVREYDGASHLLFWLVCLDRSLSSRGHQLAGQEGTLEVFFQVSTGTGWNLKVSLRMTE